MNETKSIPITKKMVWEAFKKVKRNRGSAGVDEISLEKFEKNLSNNLYKIWNRLASGSYFPPAVKEVAIPKRSGGSRKLGIPTVGDRVAQMVVKNYLEPRLEAQFHDDSYGYRLGKHAHMALEQVRKRCWKYAWVIDLDIQGFFDTLDHELLIKALQRHVDENWVLMYVKRWLEASVIDKEGREQNRILGTPQGGVRALRSA